MSTCTIAIEFEGPATVGNYQIKVTAADAVAGQGSNVRIEGSVLSINFSIIPSVVPKLDTKLTVAPKCYLLNEAYVNLTATLEESNSLNPISGAVIDFYVDPEFDERGFLTISSFPIGTATTNAGVATLTLNLIGLGVGDHNLYGEFDGNGNYNPSNDSDTLGITYMFAGFQPPMNDGGISIFGGRVIPIKIRLIDANDAPVTDAAPTVWLTSYDKDLGFGEEMEQVSSVSAANTGNIMRYVPEDQQYIYNWDATTPANGMYAVVVDLGDSPSCRTQDPFAIITVARKGKK